MSFSVGQGVLGQITFRDGANPNYPRTYLVVGVYVDYIEVLNVSSTQGKEHKLLYKDNEEIKNYNPPFRKPSFVKLDSLTRVNKIDWRGLKILCNGQCLEQAELNKIISMIQ